MDIAMRIWRDMENVSRHYHSLEKRLRKLARQERIWKKDFR